MDGYPVEPDHVASVEIMGIFCRARCHQKAPVIKCNRTLTRHPIAFPIVVASHALCLAIQHTSPRFGSDPSKAYEPKLLALASMFSELTASNLTSDLSFHRRATRTG
jgi:hypothetical protein